MSALAPQKKMEFPHALFSIWTLLHFRTKELGWNYLNLTFAEERANTKPLFLQISSDGTKGHRHKSQTLALSVLALSLLQLALCLPDPCMKPSAFSP